MEVQWFIRRIAMLSSELGKEQTKHVNFRFFALAGDIRGLMREKSGQYKTNFMVS